MNCIFNFCEFYNVFLGGLLTGVIASFIFIWLTKFLAIRKFRKQYGHLESINKDTFDWVAYSMREDNGRIRQDNPNGSTLNIQIFRDRLYLKLLDIKDRKWIGELKIEGYNFGVVTYKYEKEHEYGKKECTIGTFVENGDTYDYLYFIPTNNRIYYIQKIDNDKQSVKYNYGDEIFIRKRASA